MTPFPSLWTPRPYRSEDFPALLEAHRLSVGADRGRLYNDATLQHLITPPPEVRSGLIVVPLDTSSEVAGWLWWEVQGDRAVRMEGFVAPAFRRKGVGTALLEGAERDLTWRVPGASLALRTYADLTGAVALFHAAGYIPRRHFNRMTVALDRRWEAVALEGVHFETFQRDHLERLVDADNAIFSDHWGSQPQTIEGFARAQIEMRPHDPQLWVLALTGETIVAECLAHTSQEAAPGEREGYIAHLGVRREWRGKGLGRAILCEGLNRLRAAGYQIASLMVDADNAPAVNLYRGVGMDVVRVRVNFGKTLGG